MNAEEKDLDLNFESLEDRSRFTEILEKRFDEEGRQFSKFFLFFT